MIGRLLDSLERTPGKIQDGAYVFAKPIYLMVDAQRFVVSVKEPKKKRNTSGGHSVIFAIGSRDIASSTVPVFAMAVAIGCMRIRDAIRACDLVHAAG